MRAVSPAVPIDWRSVYAARAGIILRLNSACRVEGAIGDRHELDRRLFRAVENLVAAPHRDRPDWLARADAVEEAAQRLIKKGWDRSKEEARTGTLDG